ncbi:polyketide synthase [Colletotrichum incanum]|nr:polyketide synthase [Colletotrichum incanum]
MARPSNHILFFGDHMSDNVSMIRNLVRISKQSPAVQRLLDEAVDTLQLEFSRLSRLDHGWNKTFDSLIELAEANANAESEGGQNGVLTCALCCISRLGELVAHAERDVSILGTTSLSQSPVEVVGLCMGLLPATVAVAASDTSHIFGLARETIKVTIRMAYKIWHRMRLIDDSGGSWSLTFLRVTTEEATKIIDQFHDQCQIPMVRRVAVGVTSKGFVTLFGPPSTLAKLQTWPGAEQFRDATQVQTEAGGCVHTPYLPRLDADEILSDFSREFLEWPLDPLHKSRMASPDSFTYYEHQTLGGLLAAVMEDISHNVLRLDGTLENCAARLKAENKTDNMKLVVMGQNGHVPVMTSALKNVGITHEVMTNTPSASSTSQTTSNDESNNSLLSNRGQSGLIAIIGMSGRFPDNDTVQGFWEDLLDGKTHIREVPPDRFDVKSWYDPTLETKNSTTATKGAWLANPGLFDHRLFNISPREAAQIDPIHRYLLTCSYEALQHAGYNPGASLSMDGSNVSTFFGQLGEDWHDIIHEQGADIYYVPGIARTFAPSRVNYHYKFGGGSYAVDSACASSITTIVLACQALASRACDMALAGGGSMMYTPVPFSGLSRSGMISSTDGCRTFHDDADGYARGEGVGVVVLKRLEDALSDNDNILGVIRGSARTFSTTTTSITHPSHESQERVYKRVLAQSSLDASEIAYVEMHGTGTQAGDYEEMTSVINVLAPPGSRTKNNPLTVGTVKAAVGHGEAAAGVTALIKLLLMMREKVIPGQPGWPFKVNHRFPSLDPLNVRIATTHFPLKPSPKGDKKIKVMLNSFDASGGESCLAIEEPPRRHDYGQERASDPRTAHVVTLSGRTTASLVGNRRRLLEWLELHPNANLADVAYTTTARRMHEPLRAAYVTKSVVELVQQLQEADAKNDDPKAKPKPAGRVFLFTGQGSQYAAMGSVLFNTNKTFREKLLEYQQMATHMGLPSFLEAITNPDYLDVATTGQIQMAIVALEIGVAETLAHYGLKPTAVLGHSLGEYAALCIAGVFSITDALYLVGQRAMLMEKHLTPKTYAMLATSNTAEQLEAEYTSLGLSSCNIACKNAAAVTVASGTVEDIEKLEVHLKAKGTRTKVLRVPFGFHSPQVDPILDEFAELASGVVFKAPSVPVVSSYLGRVVAVGDQTVFNSQYLAKQCRGTVNFVDAVRAAEAAEKPSINKTLWIETGPEPVLLGLVRWTLPNLPLENLVGAIKASPSEDNWATLSGVLKAAYESGVDINWPEFHKNFKNCVRLLELPLYAFDYRDFWHEPFQRPELLMQKESTAGTPCSCSQASAVSSKPSFKPSFPGFPTTSLPVVESEDINDAKTEVVANFTADTSEPNLLRAIEGHVVHGHVICPMSVLVDMALTAAKYCHFRLHGTSESPVMSVSDIAMNNALILQPSMPKKPLVRVKAALRKNEKSVGITFSWLKFKDENADPEEETGGTCTVQFDQEEKWPASVTSSLFLVKSRIEALRAASRDGRAHRLLKPVVYRMFAETVDYSEPFRGIDEAILDIECRDAISKVTLSPDTSPGNFVMNPFWTDALTHLGGFLINSGLRYGQQDILCMARGFESWRVIGANTAMTPGKTYTTYTFMQDVEGNLVVGDCYIFDEGDNLVQTLMGLKFQKLKKSVMEIVFGAVPSSHAVSTGAKPPAMNRQMLPTKPTLPQAVPLAPPAVGDTGHAVEQTSSTPSRPALVSSTETIEVTKDASELLKAVMSIVAQEAGCRPEDLVDDAIFADLGIDSLMGISILAVIERETELDLDSNFFIQHETVGEARSALEEILGVDCPQETSPSSQASPNQEASPLPVSPRDPTELPTPPPERELFKNQEIGMLGQFVANPPTQTPKCPANTASKLAPELTAKMVHLSGPKGDSTATKLFLFADETGSSLSCIQLPALTCPKGTPITVWGVESPFSKNPEIWTGRSIQEMASITLESLRKQKMLGSSHILVGGLGAGAAIAIEVARLMQSETSSKIGGLVLLDPSLTPADIELASSAPGVRLKPVHRDHASKTAEAMGAYVMEPLPPMNIKAIAIVPQSASSKDHQLLVKVLPHVEIRTVGPATGKGMLIRFPAIASTSKIYVEAVRELAGY